MVREKTVGELAGRTYRNGRLTPLVAVLNASNGDGFMDRATFVETLTINQEKQVRNLVEAKDEAPGRKLPSIPRSVSRRSRSRTWRSGRSRRRAR